MFQRFLLILNRPSNRLWIEPAGWGLFAVLWVLLADYFGGLIPQDFLPTIKLETVNGLIDILASSMLAVSTFSLSIMVSAAASASSAATPRATELVMGDDNTRRTIATFIAAFIYSIIAKIALGIGYYSPNGLFILFISSLLMVLHVVVRLIMWVRTLSELGRMENTIKKIHDHTKISLTEHYKNPTLGACWNLEWNGIEPVTVYMKEAGFVVNINMAGLNKLAEDMDIYIEILTRPGDLVFQDTPIMRVNKDLETELRDQLKSTILVDTKRNYKQDPGWGFVVLSEVAAKALSPGINDQGTAIQAMHSMMALVVEPLPEQEECKYDRIYMPPTDAGEWISEFMLPILRDGASSLEVGIVTQKILAGISRNSPNPAIVQQARKLAEEALERHEAACAYKEDYLKIVDKHEELFGEDRNSVKQKDI